MIDIKMLQQQLDFVCTNLAKKGFILDRNQLVALLNSHKKNQLATESLQAKRNSNSKAIGLTKGQGKDISQLTQLATTLSEQLKQAKEQLQNAKQQLQTLLWQIPNLVHQTVPEGESEADNEVIKYCGEPKTYDFPIKDHIELGALHQWMDFETAAKLAGSRFVILRGPLAQLHRALGQFMLDLHSQTHGYQEHYVPFMVNQDALYGSGQLPKFRDDLFHIQGKQGYSLISTAEISLANMVREQILSSDQLPQKYVCQSPCFRSEAGSYGKDTHGMIRQHQFEKIELLQVVTPANSYQALEELTKHASSVLDALELPYRITSLCSGDLGFSATKTYDLEVFIPSQNCYREISSCSNCEDFQARRMNARYKPSAKGKSQFVHTLNGSGLAVGRTLVAVMENYQDKFGNISIPTALRPYMQGKKQLND